MKTGQSGVEHKETKVKLTTDSRKSGSNQSPRVLRIQSSGEMKMKMKMKMEKNVLGIAGALMVLAGCGGGGGSSTPASPVAPAASAPSTYSATCAGGTTTTSTISVADATALCPVGPALPAVPGVVVTVPAPTYPALSEELLAFNLLNSERERCGFGLLAQNTALDVSARGHADWLLMNGYTGHFQSPNTPGFTGIAPSDRMLAAGYVASLAEMLDPGEVEADAFVQKLGVGLTAVRGLFNAPYHLMGMLRGHKDVGVAVRQRDDLGLSGSRSVVNIDLATKLNQGQQVNVGVRTYPCAGSTGIASSLFNESPNPVPDRNLRANPLGTSVAIVGTSGAAMTITTATLTGPDGVSVPLRTPLTSVNDPNKVGGTSYFPVNEAVISADVAMKANTTYQVNVTGNDGATAFSRSFSFTTGS